MIIKIKKSSVIAFAVAALTSFSSISHAGIFDSLVGVANSALPSYGRDQLLSVRPDLDKAQIVTGIREALELASDRAVAKVVASAEGESQIKLSSDLRKAQKLARKSGQEVAFQQFEKQLNETMIAAAPAARDLLKTALEQVEIIEPRVLLVAHDAAATDFLRMRVMEKLQRQLQPVVAELLLESGAIHRCDEIASKIKFGNLLETISTDHVVESTVESFFLQLEMEERAIRHDPASRSTDLLRDVFG